MRDLIDRQAAIDGIESFRPIKPTRGETSMEAVNRSAWECAINCAESFIRTMPPSAQPEQKTGKWIYDGDCYICNQCKSAFSWWADSQTSNYCPNCGARMNEGN